MGTLEPYRMFTSRAEYRLLLREDNADLRLTEKGRELGLVDEARWRRFEQKREAIERETSRLAGTFVHPGTDAADTLAEKLGKALTREYSLADLLKRPELEYPDVASLNGDPCTDPEAAQQVAIQAKYAGYIDRQQDEVERLRRYEETPLPADLDLEAVDGLSNEVKQKLAEVRPATLAQAGRIPGVTPAAISLLLIHLKKRGALQRTGDRRKLA
jgi:tRNA uridine 5-carboxymethylaminomethyl modification enzyme